VTATTTPAHSVVIPVYNNEGTLGALVTRLADLAGELEGGFEAVFVVDGSPDGSLVILRRLLADAPFRSQLIAHSRNFGAFAAVRTGLAAAEGSMVAVMAADLQEPTSLIRDFFRHLSSGDYDVAVGTRAERDDPLASMLLARTYWRLYRRWVNPDIPSGGVDIFACTRQVATQLVGLQELNTSLVGLLYWLGYRRIEVPYRRAAREVGTSSWSLRKRVRYLLDSVYSFTDVPISMLIGLGLIGGAVTLCASVVVLVARLTGVIGQAGYTPLMLVMLLSTFTILFGLGVVGSYVWRTFENSKGRPGSIAMSHERFARDLQGTAETTDSRREQIR
jgi:polyisoprenyl-phosphate glycosyltransferase